MPKSIAIAILILVGIFKYSEIQAQGTQPTSGNGAMCVTVYSDINHNNRRDPGEDVLANVDITLTVNPGLIVRNHVTDTTQPYCFSNLPPLQYTLAIDSPFYEAEDGSPFTFTLVSGDQQTKEIGVIAKAPTANDNDAILNIPLTTPIRIGLAGLCAMGSMTLATAVGLVFYGLFLYPRRPKLETQTPPSVDTNPDSPTRP